jgi:processive 1,2-diacylglycerol beta-glucosyltransferase
MPKSIRSAARCVSVLSECLHELPRRRGTRGPGSSPPEDARSQSAGVRVEGGEPIRNPKPAIFVISFPFGGGHRAVADALGFRLQHSVETSGMEVHVADGLEAISHHIPLARLGSRLYSWLTRRYVRPLYSLLYRVTDRWPDMTGELWYQIFGSRARAWLVDTQPSVLVSTFPLATYVLARSITAAGMPVRLVSIVTDAGRVNRSWFSGRFDLLLVTDDDAFQAAQDSLGKSVELLRVTLPLRPGFDPERIPSRGFARATLGLGESRAILVWGGGQGLAHGMVSLAKAFRSLGGNVTPIFVTGSNRRLASRLNRLAGSTPVRVLTEVDDVPLLLSAVDGVMGKPGWISLSEAAASGLHTVCFDALPGQEEQNLIVARREGFASWEPNPDAAVRAACASNRIESQQMGRKTLATDVCAAIMGTSIGVRAS